MGMLRAEGRFSGMSGDAQTLGGTLRDVDAQE